LLVEPAFVKTHIVSQQPTTTIAAYTQGRQAAMQALSASVASGMEPGAVAQAILRAATARPRLRYLVGRDAKALILLKRLLPESLFERVRRRVFQAGKPANPQLQAQPRETAASD
jgi:short-subunit dehydrogenase